MLPLTRRVFAFRRFLSWSDSYRRDIAMSSFKGRLRRSCVRELAARSDDWGEGKQTKEKSESPKILAPPWGGEEGICASWNYTRVARCLRVNKRFKTVANARCAREITTKSTANVNGETNEPSIKFAIKQTLLGARNRRYLPWKNRPPRIDRNVYTALNKVS